MNLQSVSVLLLMVGCGFSVPDSLVGSYECPPAPGQPNCNGYAHREQCAELGLPSKYGVDADCRVPRLPENGVCDYRPEVLHECINAGPILCCP